MKKRLNEHNRLLSIIQDLLMNRGIDPSLDNASSIDRNELINDAPTFLFDLTLTGVDRDPERLDHLINRLIDTVVNGLEDFPEYTLWLSRRPILDELSRYKDGLIAQLSSPMQFELFLEIEDLVKKIKDIDGFIRIDLSKPIKSKSFPAIHVLDSEISLLFLDFDFLESASTLTGSLCDRITHFFEDYYRDLLNELSEDEL